MRVPRKRKSWSGLDLRNATPEQLRCLADGAAVLMLLHPEDAEELEQVSILAHALARKKEQEGVHGKTRGEK